MNASGPTKERVPLPQENPFVAGRPRIVYKAAWLQKKGSYEGMQHAPFKNRLWPQEYCDLDYCLERFKCRVHMHAPAERSRGFEQRAQERFGGFKRHLPPQDRFSCSL